MTFDLAALISGSQNTGDTESRWIKVAEAVLTGRSIIAVRYMTNEEASGVGLHGRPLILGLDDGTILYSGEEGDLLGADSEGNALSFQAI